VLPAALLAPGRSAIGFYAAARRGEFTLVAVLRVSHLPDNWTSAYQDAVYVVSPRICWVVDGAAATTYVTVDAGRRWHASHASGLPRGRGFSLSAVDDRRAWLNTSRTVYETGNGGRTWHRVALPLR